MNVWQMGKASQNWPKIWAGFEIDNAGRKQTSIHPKRTLRKAVRNKEGDSGA